MKPVLTLLTLTLSFSSFGQNTPEARFRGACHMDLKAPLEALDRAVTLKRDQAIKLESKLLGRPLTIAEVSRFARFQVETLNSVYEEIDGYCNELVK